MGAITVDSPVPYKLATLSATVEADKPSQASKQDSHNSILQKLDVLEADARFNFLMTAWLGGAEDPFPMIVAQLVGDGPQPRVIGLFAESPNEVAGVSSAVIARTLFNLKVWQTSEERAGNSVTPKPVRRPTDMCRIVARLIRGRTGGDTPHCQGKEEIRSWAAPCIPAAKRGRFNGSFAVNSSVVLRVTNDADREHVKAMLPDSMAGLTEMLSGLRRQEAIFVGQAAMLPSRIIIRDIMARSAAEVEGHRLR